MPSNADNSLRLEELTDRDLDLVAGGPAALGYFLAAAALGYMMGADWARQDAR